MKRTDATFIIAVVAFAIVFSAISLSHTPSPFAALDGSATSMGGSAGKSRDVDVGRIQRLIRQRHLSDHEAEYYTEYSTLPESSDVP